MTEWVWTWGGVSFGYIDEDALYTWDGRHVGFLPDAGDPLIFSVADGRYLGELGATDRLITKTARRGRSRRPRRQRLQRAARTRRTDRTPRVMRTAHEDFLRPEQL